MLDAPTFLDRIIAPGPYMAFAMRGPGWHRMRHRFFHRTELVDAAAWAVAEGARFDVWHAVASFRQAEETGRDKYGQRFDGSRAGANAVALKCFWYDADIARPGDGKAAEQSYADDSAAIAWLAEAHGRGLPIPNVWIRSGYGIHFYWVLTHALPVNEWQPAARAFKALLVTLGARGDVGITSDAARVLRCPGTYNFKVTHEPAAVYDMTPTRVGADDFDTQEFLGLLGAAPAGPDFGVPPAGIPVHRGLLANARIEPGRLSAPREFRLIAERCPQVKKSLEEHGEHDSYELWHLLQNLAFIVDDKDAANELCSAHRTYSEEDTEKKWALTEREKGNKDFGPPRCLAIHVERTGVCDLCEWKGKIRTPYALGVAEPGSGLPAGYRQAEFSIERRHDDDWTTLIQGVVDNVKLLRYGDAYRLQFDYTLEGARHAIGVVESEISIGVDKIRGLLVRQGVGLNRWNSIPFSDFLMAWIEELRRAHLYEDASASFGWSVDDAGEYRGLAVAGAFYGIDGAESLAMPGDRKIHESYQPKGSLARWRESAEFVIKGRPDLQTLVAAAFAAPLMEFVGESAVMSVWSRLSGARKTSAFRIGTSVWCNPITGMSAIRDTPNSVQQSLAETRVMPVYWDEIHAASRDQIAVMVEMFFNLTQGRGRARLDPRMEQRDVGFWRTCMTISGNRPIGELIDADRSHTNAGAVRIFEFRIEPEGAAVIDASSIVAQVERNYGHAGRIYAAWITENIPTVREMIAALRMRLAADLGVIGGDERFHVALLLGLVTGARIANQLGLLGLNVDAIYAFLLMQLRNQRSERQEQNPVDEAHYLSQVFERFVSDSTDDMLVTQSLSPRGRPKAGLVEDRARAVKRPGAICARALIHIGLDEREMRIDQVCFTKWCQQNRLSPRVIVGLMQRLWPVEKVRGPLASSTDWSSGAQVNYYKLQLCLPELLHHLDWGTPSDRGNVIRLPDR